jgi:two-component system phosphate regulon response regulator PhoB
VGYEEILLNRVAYTAHIGEGELDLTPTEFLLLWTFLKQPGRTFSRHELMDSSRGEDANSLERTIDVHIRSLRKKLGHHAELIETVRGIGYRFCPRRQAGVNM